jgi:hypothetical protein
MESMSRTCGARPKHLAAIGDLARVDAGAESSHEGDIFVTVHLPEEGALLETDPVFAGHRTAKGDAHPQDVGRQRFGSCKGASLTAVEQDQGMKVAIAGVKHVGDSKAVTTAQVLNGGERLAEPRPRHDPVLHDEVGADTANR